jgi:hypothetical protein
MRPLRVVAGTTVLLFAVGACGQAANAPSAANQQPARTSATPTSPTPSQTGTEVPPMEPGPSLPQVPVPVVPKTNLPPGATLLPKEQVDTSALPADDKERNVWSVNGGRTLALIVMARTACTGVQARVLEQNADLVRVDVGPMDVPQGGKPDGGQMCAQVITPQVVTVDLKVPLGNRKVVVTGG